ncbi:MAG: hypothetical protein V4620_14155 [Bacteroidota bacterium]
MKKFIILPLLVLFFGSLKAQMHVRSFWTDDIDFYNGRGTIHADSAYKANRVSFVVSKKANKQNQWIPVAKNEYNDLGVSHTNTYFNKKGLPKQYTIYHLIDSNHYDKVSYILKQDTIISTYEFNADKQITKVLFYNKKHQLYYSYVCQYNAEKRLIEINGFNKKGEQSYKYQYAYYDNGSKKEARYFNKNNKLKKIWSYACEPTGVLASKITQQNICKRRTFNPDSSYFEIYEGTDNKGRTTRRIVKFSKNSLALEISYFNRNDKEVLKFVRTFNEEGKMRSSQEFKKGKLVATHQYTYSDKGLVASWKETTAKGKNKYSYTYEYGYY